MFWEISSCLLLDSLFSYISLTFWRLGFFCIISLSTSFIRSSFWRRSPWNWPCFLDYCKIMESKSTLLSSLDTIWSSFLSYWSLRFSAASTFLILRSYETWTSMRPEIQLVWSINRLSSFNLSTSRCLGILKSSFCSWSSLSLAF